MREPFLVSENVNDVSIFYQPPLTLTSRCVMAGDGEENARRGNVQHAQETAVTGRGNQIVMPSGPRHIV